LTGDKVRLWGFVNMLMNFLVPYTYKVDTFV